MIPHGHWTGSSRQSFRDMYKLIKCSKCSHRFRHLLPDVTRAEADRLKADADDRGVMFNRRLMFISMCPLCRRLFEDHSIGDVGKWIVKNLDAEVWPDYDMVWDRTRAWEPPEDQASG